ncbi:MAG TPA: 16S rRNA (cytidine(1402)-2'-O)-methyltransferase [Acidimicrobiales bacterium]|nr:16S rRNA (cytidine(1402)-2'-O)-methyltransferase [Acidimicrobiales bacterium]
MSEHGPPARGPGRVVLVATPIGNLTDLSPRAVETLAGADLICCEDTRRTRKLLTHAGITGVRLVTMHEHNEAAMAERAVAEAAAGATVAVVSDAGLPGLSDPGERLVRAAVAAGVEVSVVPGPSAGVAALVASGLASERFCFEGFLPRKGGERAARLAALAAEPRTTVVYEAPHRVARTLHDLQAACGDGRQVAVARELTKLHEEWWRGTLAGAVAWVDARQPRGEWVLVVAGAPAAVPGAAASDDELRAAVADRLAAGADQRGAVAAVAASLGVPRRRAYQAAVELRRGARSPD